jgi:hypothetical protein
MAVGDGDSVRSDKSMDERTIKQSKSDGSPFVAGEKPLLVAEDNAQKAGFQSKT